MRTSSLWKEVQRNHSKTQYLKDCCVVVDGQNYFFNTYEQSRLPYVFGAEGDKYAKYLREVLQQFKKANVELYVVFKGSDTDINKKLSKLWLTIFDFEENQKSFQSPVFMKQIYRQVLKEEGVKCAMSVMESKDDCVRLAKILQCPVLSKDKEFFLKGAPYIPYTTMQYTSSNNSIKCQQYHLKEFLNEYSLNDKKEAIFLALSNETVFPNKYFYSFLRRLNIVQKSLDAQLKEIWKWLSERTEREALNSISMVFKSESEREKFRSHMKLLGIEHHDDNVVLNYLMDPSTQINDQPWFEKGVANQTIAVEYVYLYKYKCMMGSWAIERNDSIDSIMLSIDIIKYVYNLLTNFHPSEITIYHSKDKKTTVNTKYEKTKPKYQCQESVFENGWKDIQRFELFEHFLVTNNININIINDLPEEARMLFIALVYFTRKKTSENILVAKEVYCFIISYVMLNIVSDKRPSARKAVSGITENDSVAAKKLTQKYFRYNTCEAKRIFNKDTLKTLVELQYCLLHMNYLNTLCGSSFMTTKYHLTFNGTFVYKLLKDMDGKDEVWFIAALFRDAPTVLNYINTLMTMYKKLL